MGETFCTDKDHAGYKSTVWQCKDCLIADLRASRDYFKQKFEDHAAVSVELEAKLEEAGREIVALKAMTGDELACEKYLGVAPYSLGNKAYTTFLGLPIVANSLAGDLAQAEARVRERHFVCEAHVPTGDEHDDICPCCVAVQLDARVRRLEEALMDEDVTRLEGAKYLGMLPAGCTVLDMVPCLYPRPGVRLLVKLADGSVTDLLFYEEP